MQFQILTPIRADGSLVISQVSVFVIVDVVYGPLKYHSFFFFTTKQLRFDFKAEKPKLILVSRPSFILKFAASTNLDLQG